MKVKRANITPEGRAIIASRALGHPRIQRTSLAEKLQEELEAMGQDVPKLEVLERMISSFRNHETHDPQEKPWSIATLADYPIPPQALPAVLKAYKAQAEKGRPLTIRQAKWVSRLSAIEEPLKSAVMLAEMERLAELLGWKKDYIVAEFRGVDRFLAGLTPGRIEGEEGRFT
jgi:hypothetical protein